MPTLTTPRTSVTPSDPHPADRSDPGRVAARPRPASSGRRLVRSRGARALLAVVAAALLVASITSCSPEQDRIRDLVNSSRAANGRSTLVADPVLDDKATAVARWIAGTHTLTHSNLADQVSPGWRKLAENIGYGSTIDDVHNAYMSSAGHRANILDPAFNRIGTGYATGRCPNSSATCVYTVQEFAQY